MPIRDPESFWPGIRDKHPGFTTLVLTFLKPLLMLLQKFGGELEAEHLSSAFSSLDLDWLPAHQAEMMQRVDASYKQQLAQVSHSWSFHQSSITFWRRSGSPVSWVRSGSGSRCGNNFASTFEAISEKAMWLFFLIWVWFFFERHECSAN